MIRGGGGGRGNEYVDKDWSGVGNGVEAAFFRS